MKYNAFVDVEGNLASELGFLAKAVSEVKTRYLMNHIRLEPSYKGEGLLGVATDGKHLHLVDPLGKAATDVFGMTPGYWQVMRSYKHQERIWLARIDDSCVDWEYPNWQKVIPTGEVAYKTTFNGFKFKHVGSNRLVKLFRGFPEATAVNLSYLQSLGTLYEWAVDWYGPDKALKFTNNNRMALIMPLQMD